MIQHRSDQANGNSGDALDVRANQIPIVGEVTTEPLTYQSAEPVDTLPNSPTSWQIVEVLLKTPNEVVRHPNLLATLLVTLILAHLAYGVIVGSFVGDRQLLAAPIKIALGTVLAGVLCLPSLYVFACLSGATIRLREVATLLFGALALTSILLLGLAPVAFLFTFSTESVVVMGGIHLGIWLVAIGFGLRSLIRGVTLLHGHESWFVRVWAAVFVLCLLQMSTTLRPIIGDSKVLLTSEKRFFVQHWLDQLVEPRGSEQAQRSSDLP